MLFPLEVNSRKEEAFCIKATKFLLCLQNAHKDWVFDFCWLDDQYLVSGSRDSKMALWRIADDDVADENSPKYFHMNPMTVKLCKAGLKVRAVEFNPEYREIAALSLNGYIHIWNAETFRQVGELYAGKKNFM